jgi:hypothetical protein
MCNGVRFDLAGDLWAVSTWNSRLVEFSADGTYLNQIDLPYEPISVAFDPFGNMWIADQGDNELFKYAPTPEPSALVLLGIGAIGLLGYGRRRRVRQFASATAVLLVLSVSVAPTQVSNVFNAGDRPSTPVFVSDTASASLQSGSTRTFR